MTNLMPVLVCKHFSMTPPPSISSIPSSEPAISNCIDLISFIEAFVREPISSYDNKENI
jgi:hypothetical protein